MKPPARAPGRHRERTPGARPGGSAAPADPRPPLDAVSRALLALAAVAVLVLVSDPIADPDLGQHLEVGRAIWTSHAVPTTQLWSWPTFGESVVVPSWLFRALVWPFASIGGVTGLFVWRWLTTLAVAAIAWATARRMGASGVVAILAIVVAVVGFRQRTQVRPETLAFVLLALELWLLERTRAGDRGAAWWLVGIAWVWANAHISYWIGLAVLGAYVVDALADAKRPGRRDLAARLALAGVAMAVVSFANPFGWRALAQPFEYALVWSHEPIFRSIGELARYDWAVQWRFLTPLMLVGWPLAVLLRAAVVRRVDRVEWILMAAATTLTFSGQRFVGFLAVAAAPFLARAASELTCRFLPTAATHPAGRAVAGGLALVALTAAPLVATGARPVPRLDETNWPVAACDFVERADVRGRGMTQFGLAGYQLQRFRSDRERLPFMDIHQSGGPAVRAAYMAAHADPRAWRALDDRFGFDYALLGRRALGADSLLAFLDRDASFRLVFVDDVAAVYVRTSGPLEAIARRYGYRYLAGSRAANEALMASAARDTSRARDVMVECERAASESRWSARTLRTMAFLELSSGRLAEGERLLERVLRVDPAFPVVHGWLGQVARERGETARAVREFAAERRLHGASPGVWYEEGVTWLRAGDRARAAAAFRAELRRHPDNAAARESLAVAEAAATR